MCFSSTASFTSSILLGTVGVITNRVNKDPMQTPVASIPIVFGIQQGIEGFIWLALENEKYAHWLSPSSKAYLFFAMIFWPLFVPFAYAWAEKIPSRKKAINVLFAFGVIEASFLGYYLLTSRAEVSISGQHIHYAIGVDRWDYPMTIIYGLATMLPPFISTIPYSSFTGYTLLLSFVVTRIFFQEHVISVWCYFAAICSMSVWLVLREQNKKFILESETNQKSKAT